MLSKYQLKIIEDTNFSFSKKKKRNPNLGNKRKHKLHYQMLKLYLNIGLRFKKRYRILEFKQKSFFKPYIKRNTDLQRESKKEGNNNKKQNSKLRNYICYIW